MSSLNLTQSRVYFVAGQQCIGCFEMSAQVKSTSHCTKRLAPFSLGPSRAYVFDSFCWSDIFSVEVCVQRNLASETGTHSIDLDWLFLYKLRFFRFSWYSFINASKGVGHDRECVDWKRCQPPAKQNSSIVRRFCTGSSEAMRSLAVKR